MNPAGWYFRVLEPGPIAAGQVARLLQRPHPDWNLARVNRLLYHRTLDRDALTELAELQSLPDTWRRLARNRLAAGRVEEWEPRLQTPRDGPTLAGPPDAGPMS